MLAALKQVQRRAAERERKRVGEFVLAELADNKAVRPRKTTIPMVPRFGRAITAITAAAGCVCVCYNLQGFGVWSVKVECEGCWTENSNGEQLDKTLIWREAF